MQRRGLLKLGVASAMVLVLAGGALATLRPGWSQGRLTPLGREVFAAVGRAVLQGTLPAAAPEDQRALAGLLDRVDALVSALPPHTQSELSQLLALLGTAPGRMGVAGVRADWSTASIPDVQQALQSMRTSGLSLRQQAYHALHDIVTGAYFSDPATWPQLGYPGPVTL
jgi:hypothetical protein